MTNAKVMTDRLRGIKKRRVTDHKRRQENAHATGHQTILPEIRYSRHNEIIVYPRKRELLVVRYFAGLIWIAVIFSSSFLLDSSLSKGVLYFSLNRPILHLPVQIIF